MIEGGYPLIHHLRSFFEIQILVKPFPLTFLVLLAAIFLSPSLFNEQSEVSIAQDFFVWK